MKKPLMILLGVCLGFSLVAQVKVSGMVLDGERYPLPGANVAVKGAPSIGTSTDIDGKFSIEVPNAQAVLVFSFMGYMTVEKPVGNQTQVNVVLQDDMAALDEVVVVGYGTTKKSDVMGALSRVTEKQIKERPVQNAVQALQGKAAGVDIVSNVRPGEIGSVKIRGTRSISGTNSPLYVVDGIPLLGNMNDINPNDISSMEILKDASSTAIYGSRGANGVILITTKKGTKGRVTIDYDGTVTFDRVNSLTNWADVGHVMDRSRLSYINGNQYNAGTNYYNYPHPDADISKFGNNDPVMIENIKRAYQFNADGTPVLGSDGHPLYDPSKLQGYDWVDELTRTGMTQNHQISLSAGNDISKVYLSFGFLDNQGTQKNQSYRRYTAKLNGDITPKKWITVGTSMNASISDKQSGNIYRSGSATGAKDAYGMALGMYRLASPYDEDGELVLFPGNNKSQPIWNPLIDMSETSDLQRRMNIQANFYAEVRFVPWLKYRMNFGVGYNSTTSGNWQGSGATIRRNAKTGEAGKTSAASYNTSNSFNYIIENLLYFDKTWGVHTLGATVMQSAQYNRSESSNISAVDILYDSSKWYNLAANLQGKPSSYGTGFGEDSMMSYMARLNYSLMNRYLVTVTGRWDGASVLAEGNKWDFFPSAAVAWKMQEENWLKDVNWLNELKLRVGFGVTGNSAIGRYSTMGPLAKYEYVFGTTPAISYTPSGMPNPQLGWEKTSQWNVGVDFAFLKDRLSGTIELYQSDTKDILMSRNLPAIIGFPSITDNIGKMRNKGIEISISSVNINNPNFRWTTDVNWSANKEEIVELVNGKEDMKGNNWYIGYPLQVFRNYQTDGMWQNTPEDLAEIDKWAKNGYKFQPGQYKPKEQGEPNYKLEDDDKVIRGTNRPDWVAGMTNTFTYKNWELSFFVYARIGQTYFSNLAPGQGMGGIGYGRYADPNDFWSPTNTGAKWPQPTTDPNASNADVNRATYLNSGSFISVRNISLAYSFPDRWLSKINVKRLQLYGQVLNPFIFGSDVVRSGINPDDTNGWESVNSNGDPSGGSNNNTMLIRSYVIGLRIGL